MRVPAPSLWEYTSDRLADELHRIEGPDVYDATVFLGEVPATDPRETTLAVLWSMESHYASRAAGVSAIELPTCAAGRSSCCEEHEIWHAEQDPDGHAALA